MKTELLRSVAALSNQDLLEGVRLIAHRENEATAELIAHLAEIENRRLHLARGFPSLFLYCVRALHLSESAAYLRIQAARVSRRWPPVLERLADGRINLTTVSLLCPHLTTENHRALLDEATHRSRRQVEEIVARLRPLADVPGGIRKLPDSRGSGPPGQGALVTSRALPATPDGAPSGIPTFPARSSPGDTAGSVDASPGDRFPETAASTPIPGVAPDSPVGASTPTVPFPREDRHPPVTPLSPGRYRIQFTAGAGTVQKLGKARDLLRHSVPDGNPGVLFDRALTVLVTDLEKKRFAEVTRPRSLEEGGSGRTRPSRHIPAEVRRVVWKRDEGRCAYIGPGERRCEQTGWLEFHHRKAFAKGGLSIPDNLELRCRAHNQYEAVLEFGVDARGGTQT